jgi:rRNA maturation RNase YbeY
MQKGMSKLMQGGIFQLVLVDDPTIQKINREYRGMNKPTDVISLSYFEEPQFPGEKGCW